MLELCEIFLYWKFVWFRYLAHYNCIESEKRRASVWAERDWEQALSTSVNLIGHLLPVGHFKNSFWGVAEDSTSRLCMVCAKWGGQFFCLERLTWAMNAVTQKAKARKLVHISVVLSEGDDSRCWVRACHAFGTIVNMCQVHALCELWCCEYVKFKQMFKFSQFYQLLIVTLDLCEIN